jgi:hypothetical protein
MLDFGVTQTLDRHLLAGYLEGTVASWVLIRHFWEVFAKDLPGTSLALRAGIQDSLTCGETCVHCQIEPVFAQGLLDFVYLALRCFSSRGI